MESYAGFLEDFGSEIGTTLEDLATDWGETEYDYADEVPLKDYITKTSRASSLQSRPSMDSMPGISDWSLKKARPLAFSNPVYHLLTAGEVVSKPQQMTLIPLNQFEINKNHDDSGKKHKKGLMNKLNKISIRKSHSVKKNEQDMRVTAPLWTDVPTVIRRESVKRTKSLVSKPSIDEEENENQRRQSEEKIVRKTSNAEERQRPMKLDLEAAQNVTETGKGPPVKTPRTAKGNFSPLEQSPKDLSNDDSQTDEGQNPPALDLPDGKTAAKLGSTSSLASDLSDGCIEEERTTKTMMEVMHEMEDDSANVVKEATPEENQPKENNETENATEEPRLKRNKTLKWSGSRAAPALIREFTRKSKKQASHPQQAELAATESPDVSASESPAKSLQDQPEKDTQNKLTTPKTQLDGLKASPAMKKRDSSAFTVLSSLLPPAPKLRRSESTKIRMYIHKMGTNTHNALGYATTEFVKQTLQSSEYRPVVLLHSIRSFMTDIKKYLISNPHVGFMPKIQKIVKSMPSAEVEGAIDDALERLVLYPLRDFIYKKLVMSYARSGKIKTVEDTIKIGQTKSPQELGIRSTLIPPNEEAMEMVKHHFQELQTTYSPYYKLKHLLSAVTTIYENTTDKACEDQSARKIGADDFLPLLVLAIIKCSFAAADIEAQYIDGLLDPTLLLGEGGYYLTTLISAVQVLASIKKREAPLPLVTDLQGFLKVGISSKTEVTSNESIMMHKTLHVPPSMTAHNLGMMIAKKYGIKQTKSFCLHVVVNGIAYPLKPQEFPQLVKMDLMTQFSPGSFFFVYRQMEETSEKAADRPATMDSAKLKLNTEEGVDATVAGEVEAENPPVKESESTTESKDNSPNEKKPNLSLDIPARPENEEPEEIQSPGFADIPLPDDVISHIEHEAEAKSQATASEADFPPPAQDEQIDAKTTEKTDYDESRSKNEDNSVVVHSNTPPPPPSELEITTDVPPTAPSDIFTPPDPIYCPPGVPTGSEAKIDSDIPLPENVSPPPPDVKVIPPPVDDADSSSSLINDDVVQEELHSSPSRQYHGDTSDGEYLSDEDGLTDESYLQGTQVDDVVSPIKKPVASTKVDPLSPLAEEEITLTVGEDEGEDRSSKSQATDVKSRADSAEQRPESALSNFSNSSDGRGFLSDSGHFSDGRHSSRGYHSDGNFCDDESNPRKPMDLGALTSVTALKNYFQGEIDKVSEKSRTSSVSK